MSDFLKAGHKKNSRIESGKIRTADAAVLMEADEASIIEDFVRPFFYCYAPGFTKETPPSPRISTTAYTIRSTTGYTP